MQEVKDQLHQAAESVHKAGKAAYDKVIDPGVRGHLRDATSHMLKAAIGVLHAADKCVSDKPLKEAAAQAPTPIDVVPVSPQG